MLTLSPAAEYAVRALEVVARDADARPVTLNEVCQRSGVGRDYLAKILGALAKQGLVQAVRGKRGGYRLGRPAEEVSLLAIIEAAEGPIALNFCQHDPPQCDREGCPAGAAWADIQDYMRSRLGEVTLAELAGAHEPSG